MVEVCGGSGADGVPVEEAVLAGACVALVVLASSCVALVVLTGGGVALVEVVVVLEADTGTGPWVAYAP